MKSSHLLVILAILLFASTGFAATSTQHPAFTLLAGGGEWVKTYSARMPMKSFLVGKTPMAFKDYVDDFEAVALTHSEEALFKGVEVEFTVWHEKKNGILLMDPAIGTVSFTKGPKELPFIVSKYFLFGQPQKYAILTGQGWIPSTGTDLKYTVGRVNVKVDPWWHTLEIGESGGDLIFVIIRLSNREGINSFGFDLVKTITEKL